MRLSTLTEDYAGAAKLQAVANAIERDQSVSQSYPHLSEQLRTLASEIAWRPPLTMDDRHLLANKMGMRIGRELPDRSHELGILQQNSQFDYGKLETTTHGLQARLMHAFPHHTIMSRTKSKNSITNKLKSPDYAGKGLSDIKDLVGARILCSDISHLPAAASQFETAEIHRKRNFFHENDDRALSPSVAPGDYYAVNYLIREGGWAAEVQLTSDKLAVWNDLEHVLLYKPESDLGNRFKESLVDVRDNILWAVFMPQPNI